MLEVPVGTGVLSMPVYERLPDADITCLDYSPDMMEGARRQAEKRSLENVSFMQGDAGKLPFPDGSFDLVLSLNGFHAFPDKEEAFRYRFKKGVLDTDTPLKVKKYICGGMKLCGEKKLKHGISLYTMAYNVPAGKRGCI